MDPIITVQHENHHQSETTSNWTDEKHLHFLASMEATFVRTMLVQSSSSSGSGSFGCPHPDQEEKQLNNTAAVRLDRYVPDMSESTLDLHSKRRRTASNRSATDSVLMRQRIMKRSSRNTSSIQRRIRVPLTLTTTSSQDQVVPQLLLRQDKNQLPISNM